jgi:uncharacterized protein YecT (DUF1311 family)
MLNGNRNKSAFTPRKSSQPNAFGVDMTSDVLLLGGFMKSVFSKYCVIFTVLVTAFSFARPAHADCSTQPPWVDKEYCQAQEYQAADQARVQTFQELLSFLNPPGQLKLEKSEAVWNAQLFRSCTVTRDAVVFVNYECATTQINERVAALKALLLAQQSLPSYNGQ